MTNVVPSAKELDLEHLTNDQLRHELGVQIALTADALFIAARIWIELQRRGVDMSALRSGLGRYLPLIARSELAPEAVVSFAGQRKLLQCLVGMPLEDQRRYAAGKPIELAERDEAGRMVMVSRRFTELSGREVMLAVDQGRVRSGAEQRSSLARQAEQPTRIRRRSGSVVQVAAKNGLLQIGRTRLEPLDLAVALRVLGFELVRRDT